MALKFRYSWHQFNYLVNTIVGKPFKDWINTKMSIREKSIVNKKRFTVKVLPKFAQAFKSSSRVSGMLECPYFNSYPR